MSRTPTFEAAGRTDIGRVRETNQDVLLVRPDRALFVVADGKGSDAAGELAASLAVVAINAAFDAAAVRRTSAEASSPSDDDRALLVAAVKTANRSIQDAAARDRTKWGMGTTVVAAVTRGETLCLAHVGDSRVYRLRDRRLRQLTDDHTLSAELIQQGAQPAFANSLAMGRALTRALGTHPTVEVSTLLETVRPGDVLLLCSDGVHRGLTSDDLTRILLDLSDLASGVERLIARANEVDGQDNSTAILVRWSR